MRDPSGVGARLSAIAAWLALTGVAQLASAAFSTPPLIIGQPLEAGPQAGGAVAAVWGGDAFMTVWSDDRSGQTGIYGARVTADGTLLNHPNLVFATDQTNLDYPADAPALAFDGTNFLVAWRQQDHVWVRRFDRTGKALDAKATRVSSVGGGVGRPSVVFDGSNYVVVMRERYSDTMWNEVRATRVSRAGVPLDPSSITVRFTLVKDAPLVGDPVARAGAAGTLIVWSEGPPGGSGSLLGTVIPAGALPTQTMSPLPIATGVGAARYPLGVEPDGTSFFVAWTEQATGSSKLDVRGRSVSMAAELGAPITLLTGISSSGGGLAADGPSWLLGWYESGADNRPRATVARVGRGGALVERVTLDDQGLMAFASGLSLALASGDGHALAVWKTQIGPRQVPHAAPVPAAGGAKAAPTRLAYALSRQSYPAMASDGKGYLVAWSEQRDAGYSLFGARVDVQQGVLDGTGFPIWSGAFAASGPAVASSGDGYLVAWASGLSSMRARTIGADGKLRGAQELAVFDGGAAQPRVASTGGVYLIAWGCTTSKVCLARVSAAGVLLDATPNEIPTGAAFPSPLRVSASTGQFLVTWYDLPAKATRAARINATTGAILDPTGTLLPAIGTDAVGPVCGVASSGDQYLLVWKRSLGGVVAARLSPELAWQDTALIALPHTQENSHIDLEDYPGVVWGGADYLVAWGNEVDTIYADPMLEELRLVHVSKQGAIVSGGTLYSGVPGFLTRNISSEGPPMAAGAGHVLVGDTVVDSSYGYKVTRNRAWLWSVDGTCPDALCAQPVIGLPGLDGGAAPDSSSSRDAGTASEGGVSSNADASPDVARSDAPVVDAAMLQDAPRDTTSAGPDAPQAPSSVDGSDARASMPAGSGCSCAVPDPSHSPTPLSGLLLLALLPTLRRWRRRSRH